VLDATNHGSDCLQTSTLSSYSGSEDCLFLNVYSPSLTERHPVMVYIHGGSFTGGSGSTFLYGPEPLVGEKVVLVTINYRLGAMGFLSTGDRHAQGNYGLKDCIEALQWVQDNIQAFGGDPRQVTVFGESAGSVLVNFLVFSPLARGLFVRAISQSGTALSPWAFQRDPRPVAFDFGQKMGLNSTTTQGLINELRAVQDLSLFVKHMEGWLDLEVPRGQFGFQFAPVAEKDIVEPAVVTEEPLAILRSGRWNNVPYIIGSNSHESLFVVRETIIDPNILTKFEENPHYLIPTTWNVSRDSPEADDIAQTLQNVYFDGEGVKIEKIDYVDFASDTHFHYPTFKTVEMMAAAQEAPIYNYVFAFEGILNYPKHLLLLDGYPGAMHGDDVCYLFKIAGLPAPVLPGSATAVTRSRMTQMWSNFANTGNPTPFVTSTIPVKWERVGKNHEFLRIEKDLVPSSLPFGQRMSAWKTLDAKYGP